MKETSYLRWLKQSEADYDTAEEVLIWVKNQMK
jgi:hypothetical protein